MSQAVYELLLRHPDLLTDATIVGNGSELPANWLAKLRECNSRVLTWDWQTYLAYHSVEEDHKTFAMPHNQLANSKNVILLWPKSKLLAQQLVTVIASQTSQCYIAGANDAGGKSIGKACAEIAEESEKLDSARRCSLWHMKLPKQEPINWLRQAQSFTWKNNAYMTLPGVFNHGKLDTGTRVLLEHLPAPSHGKLLDLGCGSGVIGLSLKVTESALDITLSDVDAFALRSAELNAMRLGIKADVIASDGLQHIDGRFDYIISNPPFHQGKDTDYSFAEKLFIRAKLHLVADGQLWIVANRHLAYEEWAQQHFHQVEVLAQQDGFKILCLSMAR